MRRRVAAGVVLSLLTLMLPASDAATTRRWLGRIADVRLRGASKVAHAGDVNGDGRGDLLVSIGDFAQEPHYGITYVVFGGPDLSDRDLTELSADEGFAIHGHNVDDDDRASFSAGAGDVNGDGLADVVVGAPNADNNGDAASGTAYVVFGKSSGEDVFLEDFDADTQGRAGYRIDGSGFLTLAGRAVAGAGDVNGDGLADVLVGSPFAGAAYVVFGKATPEAVDLRLFDAGTQGSRGYRITTPSPDSDEQYSVANAGDVNGDGIPDAIVGVIPRLKARGAAYVVFGKASADPVEVRAPGAWGFRIAGREKGDFSGESVAGAGDVNGDGYDDVLVGAPETYTDSGIGQAYVVFGKAGGESIELGDLGDGGYRIVGRRHRDDTGNALASAGDVNGDGRPDAMVGARFATVAGEVRGIVYVVYGKARPATIRLDDLGRHGYRIDGVRASESGSAVASGDVDGRCGPDLLIGAYFIAKAFVVAAECP